MTAREAIGFLLFPVGVIAGFAVAWRRELAGGLVTVGSLSLFYLWEFARDGQLPAGSYFLLFVTGAPPRRERPTHRAPRSGRGHCLSRR